MLFGSSCEHLLSLLLALDSKATHHSHHTPKHLEEPGSGRGESREVPVCPEPALPISLALPSLSLLGELASFCCSLIALCRY